MSGGEEPPVARRWLRPGVLAFVAVGGILGTTLSGVTSSGGWLMGGVSHAFLKVGATVVLLVFMVVGSLLFYLTDLPSGERAIEAYPQSHRPKEPDPAPEPGTEVVPAPPPPSTVPVINLNDLTGWTPEQ